MENQKNKTPWYRITGVVSDETKVPPQGKFMALLHLLATGGITYVVLLIALVVFSAFVYDVYDVGSGIVAVASLILGIRAYKKEISRHSKKEKWYTGNLPAGYPSKCNIAQLKEVIQDLNDERHRQLQSGKVSPIWDKQIESTIKAGQEELNLKISTKRHLQNLGLSVIKRN